MVSLGFDIVFRIENKNLLWAGVGGVLYAEIMAMRQKMPSTVFLYPAVIPLIPGDLLYNMAVSLILQDTAEMRAMLKIVL